MDCFAYVVVVSRNADEVGNGTLGSGAGITWAVGGAGSVVPGEMLWGSALGSGLVLAACAAKME